MIEVNIDVDNKQLKYVENELDKMQKKTPSILKKAVNATARKAKSKLASKVIKRYATNSSEIRQAMQLKSATVGQPSSTIMVKGSMKEIKEFKVAPMEVSKGRNRVKYLTAKVLKSSSMKPLLGSPKPFVAQFESLHISVVRRVPGEYMKKKPPGKQKPKEKLEKLLSPSVTHMIGNDNVYREVEPEIRSILEKQIREALLESKGGS